MIGDIQFLSDQLAHPYQRPPVGGKSVRQGSPIQHPSHLLLLGRAQLRLAACGLLLLKTSHSFGCEGLRPIADRRPAHAQLPRNLRLGQLARSQQASACQTPFLHLIPCQIRWFPCHAPDCKPISVNLNSFLMPLAGISQYWQCHE